MNSTFPRSCSNFRFPQPRISTHKDGFDLHYSSSSSSFSSSFCFFFSLIQSTFPRQTTSPSSLLSSSSSSSGRNFLGAVTACRLLATQLSKTAFARSPGVFGFMFSRNIATDSCMREFVTPNPFALRLSSPWLVTFVSAQWIYFVRNVSIASTYRCTNPGYSCLGNFVPHGTS